MITLIALRPHPRTVSAASMTAKNQLPAVEQPLRNFEAQDQGSPYPQEVWQPALVQAPEPLSPDSLLQAVQHTTVLLPLASGLRRRLL